MYRHLCILYYAYIFEFPEMNVQVNIAMKTKVKGNNIPNISDNKTFNNQIV